MTIAVAPQRRAAHTCSASRDRRSGPGGTISTDDYYAGTRSDACGGTTTVFDFALQTIGEPMDETIKRRRALADPDVAVDYSFHIGVCDVTNDAMLDSMEKAMALGVPSFKVRVY